MLASRRVSVGLDYCLPRLYMVGSLAGCDPTSLWGYQTIALSIELERHER